MSDIIFFSFYTSDSFYSGKAEILASNLEKLGVEYSLLKTEIPEGKEWPDICREKVGYLLDFYKSNFGKKIFWIDVDCELNYLPSFVTEFSADIIGFQRGFGKPLNIGYHRKTRFWEPCFLGFNTTPIAEKFLTDAHFLEQGYKGRATDDYFLEESWRANCSSMSYQLIPSHYAELEGRKEVEGIKPFFRFGSSGNVKDFASKVDQHKVTWIESEPPAKSNIFNKKRNKNVIEKYWKKAKINITLKQVITGIRPVVASKLPDSWKVSIKKLLSKKQKFDDTTFRIQAYKSSKKGDWDSLNKLIKANNGYGMLSDKQQKVVQTSYSFLYYADANKESDPIYLSWWATPDPGNFGDWLSPYIASKISGKSILFINPESKSVATPHYFCVGSIGKFVKANSIVLGTGISRADAQLNPNAAYRFVRGPRTRVRVMDAGGTCPARYGDPAIALPKLYRPEIVETKSSAYLLVRHFTHLDLALKLPPNLVEESILVSHPKRIESFIQKLHSHAGVVTSAMHCYIICQAYGIPVALITFKEKAESVHGDGVKYIDYCEGAGVPVVEPIPVASDLRSLNIADILTHEKIKTEKVEEVYGLLVDEFVC